MPHSLCFLISAALLSACSSAPSARSFADIEATVARTAADWKRSQLTSQPQRGLGTRFLRHDLFFQLPFEERVVVVMDSFATSVLDGELAFLLSLKLHFRTKESIAARGSSNGPSADDRAYTAAIFQKIESYPDEQVRLFCMTEDRYQMFKENLRRWKTKCLPTA